jgi:serine/threonine-protein kinase HipA
VKEVDRLVDVVRHWRDGFFACGVSAKDIDYIALAILPGCFFFEKQPDA